MTFEEFMQHAADAAYMGDANLLRSHAREVFDELKWTQQELERITRERDLARSYAGLGVRRDVSEHPDFRPSPTHAAESAQALANREEKGK